MPAPTVNATESPAIITRRGAGGLDRVADAAAADAAGLGAERSDTDEALASDNAGSAPVVAATSETTTTLAAAGAATHDRQPGNEPRRIGVSTSR